VVSGNGNNKKGTGTMIPVSAYLSPGSRKGIEVPGQISYWITEPVPLIHFASAFLFFRFYILSANRTVPVAGRAQRA